MGDAEYGTCNICGKKAMVNKKYYYYNIPCECHNKGHFDIVYYCKDCQPQPPKQTKITLSYENALYLSNLISKAELENEKNSTSQITKPTVSLRTIETVETKNDNTLKIVSSSLNKSIT